MLKRYVMMSVVAASFAGAAVSAQSQATPSQQPPATERPQATPEQRPETMPARPAQPTEPASTATASTTRLSGCVYREQDIAGRSPNVAERAGVLEDYILADVKAASESADATSASAAAASPSTAGAVGTSGSSAPMYKLEQVADERLATFVGKRVEVVGRVDAEAEDSAANRAAGAPRQGDASAGPDRINLAEFEVSEIREVAGNCPAKPAGGR